MKKKIQTAKQEAYSSAVQQYEDAILKTSMQFFAEELLPYLGIHGKVVSFAPTELVHLELKKLAQDFNLVMEDGSWKHFEFQSTYHGLEDLKRFRTYEAMASYQNKVAITTYVLFSGKIKNPLTEYTEGINTYRICPIIMQDHDADLLFLQLQEKIDSGQQLTKGDLIPLVLCPLMSGGISIKDRIKLSFSITRNATSAKSEDVRKIDAMLYAMAEKFLETLDLDELKEELSMTRLGQMIYDDGIAKGISEGITQGIQAFVESCKELEISKESTLEKLTQKFNTSPELALEYLEKYWK